MNKLVKRAAVAALTAIVLFTGMPAKSVKAADDAPVRTVAELSGKADNQKIVYKLKLDDTYVTDGRIGIAYDPEVLELVKKTENQVFKESDVNTDYTDGELSGLSIAFVGDKAAHVNRTILTLTFEVKQGLLAQDTVIKTKVFGLNNEDEVILADDTLVDTFNVGKDEIAAPVLKYVKQSLVGVNAVWSKDKNADGYYVYRREGKNGTFEKVAEVDGSSYWDTHVENGKTYYYQIVAFQNTTDGELTKESNVIGITVKKFAGIFG